MSIIILYTLNIPLHFPYFHENSYGSTKDFNPIENNLEIHIYLLRIYRYNFETFCKYSYNIVIKYSYNI